jgi:hypothetical protein
VTLPRPTEDLPAVISVSLPEGATVLVVKRLSKRFGAQREKRYTFLRA